MTASIVAAVQLETKGVQQGVQQVQGKLRGMASSTASVFKGVLGANVVGKALNVAGSGLKSFTGLLGDSIDEARESEVVGKTTAQIIKATGGAAKISSDQVGDLAMAISNKTGVDDEAIQSGSNLLLTFKNVRNEAGKGNQVFDRATQAAVDLSKAGFGSIEGSSKMLGKALNDPVKGISALSRAGVTFTDDQKKTIKSMVATGDVLGAQKLIMKEVEGQVGGVAAANATAGEKAKVMAGNLKEQFGTALLPVLDKAAGFFVKTLGPAISKGIDQVGPAIDKVVSLIGPAISKVSEIVGPIVAQVQSTLSGIFAGGGGFGAFLAQVQPLGAALAGVFGSVKALLASVLPIVMQVFSTIVSAVQSSMPQLISAYQAISSTISSIASIITTVWAAIGPVVLPIIKSVFGTIITVVSGALNIVAGIFKTISAVLRGDWSGAWAGIKQIVSGAWSIIKGVVKNAGVVVRGIMSALMASVKGLWSAGWAAVKSVVSAAWSAIKGAVSAGIGAAKSVVSSGISTIKGVMSAGWNAVKSTVSSAWARIKSAVSSGVSNAVSVVRSLPGKAKSALGNIGSLLYSSGSNLVKGFINGISGSIGSVISKAREIAHAAVNAAKSALGIASPSKVFKQIGAYVGQGFVKGLQGTEAQVKSSVAKMVSLLRKEAQQKGKAGDRARAAARAVYRIDDKLIANAKLRAAVTTKIAAAQSKLNDLIKQRADYAASVTDAARGFASITGIKMEDDLPQTTANLITGLQERLRAIQNYTGKLAALKARGLNSSTYDQLVQAGVEGGTEYVNALFSGDQSVISQINSLQGSINSATGTLGQQTADAMYKAGVQAQQGLLAGLVKDQAALEKTAAALAKSLTDAVKKALKIKSPSRVFREIGDNVTQGLSIGLDDKQVAVQGRKMAGALESGFGSPALSGSAAAGGGGNSYMITVNVPLGTSKAEVGREIVTVIKEYEKTSGRKVLAR